MLKISFKDGYKRVLTDNRKTVVTLTGRMAVKLEHIPRHMYVWAMEHSHVDVNVTYKEGHEYWILKVSGKAKCHEDDTPNAKIGERIAESRAKIKIYRYMYTFCRKLLYHYFGVMYGNREVDLVRESHSKPPKDCVWIAYKKYQKLLDHERHHLTELLQETVV